MKTFCLWPMSPRLMSPRLMSLIGAALLVVGLHVIPTPADQTASQSAPVAISAQNDRPSGDGAARGDAGANRQERPGGSAKSRPRVKAPGARPHRPQSSARQRTFPEAVNPATVRSFAPAQSAAVVNRGSLQNEAIYRALPVRSGSAVRPGAVSAGNLRHRDPNAPVIGGAAGSSNRNTAAIDGTRTNLKRSRN